MNLFNYISVSRYFIIGWSYWNEYFWWKIGRYRTSVRRFQQCVTRETSIKFLQATVCHFPRHWWLGHTGDTYYKFRFHSLNFTLRLKQLQSTHYSHFHSHLPISNVRMNQIDCIDNLMSHFSKYSMS